MNTSGTQQMGDVHTHATDGQAAGNRAAWVKSAARRLPANMAQFDFLRSSVSHFTLLVTSLFLLVVFGLTWAKFQADYNTALDRAEEATRSVATLTEARLDTLFGGTAAILDLVEQASGALSNNELVALAQKAETSNDNIHRLLIVDSMGRHITPLASPLTASQTSALNASTSSNWDQRKDVTHAIFARAASSGVDTQAWFALSRQLKKENARRVGAERFAVALISRDKINAFLATSNMTALMGRAGTVSLVSASGKIHAVYPQARSSEQTIALDEAITLLHRTSAAGTAQKTGLDYLPLSKGSFLSSHRQTEYGAALIVLVPMTDAMASLRKSGPLLVSFAIVAILFALAFASFLTRQIRHAQSTDHQLEQSELLFELAAASAKCGLWDWNLERDEMFWSSSIMQLLGFDSGGTSLTFNQALNLVHPSDRKYLRRAEKSMRDGQTEFDTRFRLKHANGHFLWMRARGEVKIVNQIGTAGQGGSPRFYGIIIDMTDELMANAREEQAKTNLQNAIENISDAFVLWDRNHSPVLTNTKYETMPPFDASTAWEALDEDRDIELEPGRWVQLKSNKIAGGGVVTLARDITDLKMKNAALEESRGALGETIKDLRTSRSHLRVLAGKFEEEKRRAEEANRSKTEFLANMSHELRTPLNAIIGFSEIMETGMFGPLGDARYNDYAGDIRKSGRNLLELINDILDMSRIESGKYEVENEMIDTSEMIDDCMRIIEPRASEKQIAITNTINLAPDIYGDRGALRHVLMNILSNAIKFNKKGCHVTLTSEADHEQVTISIRDDGVGIAKSDLEKLGTAFVQFENHAKKKHAGSGLGIAISMSLVELMSGRLVIESEAGAGTCVSISLPRRSPPDAPPAAPAV